MRIPFAKSSDKNSMRLQSIGYVQGTESRNIKAGDTLVWNFGGTENVEEIVKVTEKTISIRISSDNNYTSVRRLNKTRLVCIAK